MKDGVDDVARVSGNRGTTALSAGLCLPTIAGVAILAALALTQQSSLPSHALLGGFFAVTWMPAFLGAAYGPILIPVGAVVLLHARRRYGSRARVGWIFIVSALLAACVSHLWVLDAVELP